MRECRVARQTPQARELARSDLILSHFSLLGLEDFERRVSAAAGAGFSGIGLFIGDYLMLRDEGRDDAWIEQVLARSGVCLAELEVLVDWCPLADRGLRWLETACHIGERFKARHVVVNGPFSGPLRDAGPAFARLCDAAAEAGLLVALEHLPFTNVDSLTTALGIVEAAGRDNGGLCLDSWHHFRGGENWEVLKGLPAGRINSVQLNDGLENPVVADYYHETVNHRLPPGDGAFDLERYLAALHDCGYAGPVSVEVLSDDLRELPPERVCSELARATRRLVPA